MRAQAPNIQLMRYTMLELSIVGALAVAAMETMRQHWQQQQARTHLARATRLRTSALPAYPIAATGSFRVGTPTEPGLTTRFRGLRALPGGLAFNEVMTGRDYLLAFADMRWFGDVRALGQGHYSVSLHMEVAGRWQILMFHLAQADLVLLRSILKQKLPGDYMHVDYHPVQPLPARIAGQNLQGDTFLEEAVSLYVLPHLLVVMRGERVLAKLSTRSIRRVLAIERMGNQLGRMLLQAPGVVRLHSMYETVAFALAKYRELADELAHLAHCPIEYVSREDKRSKF